MEQAGTCLSTIDPARRRASDLGRALIEEAWRRTHRRRLAYGGVVFSVAVIGAIVLGILKGPAQSQSTSLAVPAGPSAPAPQFVADQHVYVGVFDCIGKLGELMVYVYFESSGSRSWDVGRSPDVWPRAQAGQYRLIRYGSGERVHAGGNADEWHAWLVGVVIPKTQPAKSQRVVIRLTGRPKGTFVLIPTEPGVLKRDSGTQSSSFFRG